MSTEPGATSLYPALLAAMREFNPVVKNKQNPHLKNFYADLSAVLEAVTEPLANHGLLIVQRFSSDQGTPILITEIVHAESGQSIRSELPIVSKDPTDPQKLGGAITYARRYSLLAILSLTAEDDDGNAASKPAPPRQQPAAEQSRPTPASNGTNAPQRPESKREMTEDEALLAVVRDHRRSRSGTREAADNYMSKAYTIADLETRYKECRGMADDDRTELYQKHLQRFERQQPRPAPASNGTPAPAANGTAPAPKLVGWNEVWLEAKARGIPDRPALDKAILPEVVDQNALWKVVARLKELPKEAAAPAAPPPSH